jgi:hypothetical protein
MWVSVSMAFKLTYNDGQESDYDDDTKWEVEGGVLKLGRGDGNWTVLVSPGHWATLELGKGAKKKDKENDDKDQDKNKDKDRNKDDDKDRNKDDDDKDRNKDDDDS